MQYQLDRPIVTAKKRHPRRWLFGGLLLLLTVSLAVKLATAPSQGHSVAVDLVPQKTRLATATPTPASTLDNQYFSLHLPAGFSLRSAQTTAGDSLQNATIFQSSGAGTTIISVAVVAKPADGMTSLSGYQARVLKPADYSFSNETIAGEPVTIITRIDGEQGEVTAFWPHAGYVATLGTSTALQDGHDTSANRATLVTLLHNWQWH